MRMGVDFTEGDHMFLILDLIHEFIVLKYSIFGMITPYIYPNLKDVGLI